MTFENICNLFTIKEPFYGILLSSMKRVEDCSIDTMCVCIDGSVFALHWNPDFVGRFSTAAVMELLKHEVLHVAFNHFTMFSDDEMMAHKNLTNVATDMEVNCWINKNLLQSEGLHPVDNEDFNLASKEGSRFYYRQLIDRIKEDDDSSRSMGVGSTDSHDKWKPMSKDDKFATEARVENMLLSAAEESERSCSSIPSELQSIICLLRAKKAKPVLKWDNILRRMIGNSKSYFTKKSHMRESKRFPEALGVRHANKSNIVVAIDTSASINMKDYVQFMSQIRTLKEHSDFYVLECDTSIRHEYKFKGVIPSAVHGGGGTLFSPVIDWYNKRRKQYECLVYFTDGECDIPNNCPKNMIWVISSGGNTNKNHYPHNCGKVVFIKE